MLSLFATTSSSAKPIQSVKPHEGDSVPAGAEVEKEAKDLRGHDYQLVEHSKASSVAVILGRAVHVSDSKGKRLQAKGRSKAPSSVPPFHQFRSSSSVQVDNKGESSGALASSSSGSLMGMLNPSVVYRFRISDSGFVTSTAGGSCLTGLNCDPSLFSINDWTGLNDLFDECRTYEARLHIVPLMLSTSTGVAFLVGYQRSASTTAPGSATAVQALPDSRMVGGTQSVSPGPKGNFEFSSGLHPNSLYASMSAPSAGVDQGTFGAFWIANVNTAAISSVVFAWQIELFVECRGRS